LTVPGAASDTFACWHAQLRDRVGLSEAEIVAHHDALDAFCARHRVTPAELLATWQSYPELTVRRRAGAAEAPDVAVESFLIHNGINVFGDIVCVAGRPEDLVMQGSQFLPPRYRHKEAS
jgi:hypothetical protein